MGVTLGHTESVCEDRSKLLPSPSIQSLGQCRHLGSRASVEEIDAQCDRTVAFFSRIDQSEVGTILRILLQTKEPRTARRGCRIRYGGIEKSKRAASAWS